MSYPGRTIFIGRTLVATWGFLLYIMTRMILDVSPTSQTSFKSMVYIRSRDRDGVLNVLIHLQQVPPSPNNVEMDDWSYFLFM